jgi:hypothetical protein
MRERLFTVSHRLQADPRGYAFSGRPGPVVPYLRKSGRWLGGLGFAIGSRVRVSAEPGRLVLELAEPAGEVASAPAPQVPSVSGHETHTPPGRPRRSRRTHRPRRPAGRG